MLPLSGDDSEDICLPETATLQDFYRASPRYYKTRVSMGSVVRVLKEFA